MYKYRRILICILILLNSCESPKEESTIEKQFNELYEKGLFNGSIIVKDSDDLIFSKGYGYANFELQIPFGTSTTMDTGSITKTLRAYAMLMLAKSRQIDLNSPVSNFLSEFPYKAITINHLLYQTSGLVSDDYVFDRAPKGLPLTNDIFLEFLIADHPDLEFTCGSQFQYNGFNHIILATLIEKISGLPYDQFIKEKIADPLEMKDWFLRPVRLDNWPKERTLGYKLNHKKRELFDSEDWEGFYGNCNLFFSAEDLVKWSESFYSKTVISDDKLSNALTMKSDLSNLNLLHWYNLGFQNEYHFTGDWKGFYAMVYFNTKRKRSIVYLTNTDMPYWLRPELVRKINDFIDNGRISDWEYPKPVEVNIEDISGTYMLENNQLLGLQNNDNELKIQIDKNSFSLFKLDSHIYYAPGIDLWLWFSKDDNQNLIIHCSSIYYLKKGKKITTNN